MFVADPPSREGRSVLWTIELDESGLTPLLEAASMGGRAPVYSPEGDSIAFVAADGAGGPAGVSVSRPAGRTPVLLADLPLGAGSPAWSPDGTRLAFAWELSVLGRIVGLGTS